MKYIITLTISVLLLHAQSEKITSSEHTSIHHHNFKAVLKMQEPANMHDIHKIDEKEAKKLIKKMTNEKVISLKLTHFSRVLYYKALTKNYLIEMNAMDASIIKKEKRK